MKNWKTILSGVLTLGLTGLSIAHNPTSILDPQTIAAITAGVGLLFAKQHNVTGGTIPQAGGTEPANPGERMAAVQK